MTNHPTVTPVQLDVEPHAFDDLPQYGTYAGELYILATPENLRMLKTAPDLLAFVESITDASGPYAYLNSTPIVADAYRLAAKARGEAA